jgi:nicotinate-nucleotide adenylyltransferase
MTRTVALFGGSFNPPHVGHYLVTAYVLATCDVERVWLMPAHRHPFGKELAGFEHRVELCRRMAALFAGGVEVTRVEEEVPGEGRTVDTLEHLAARHPGLRFRLVIGSDIAAEVVKWKAWDRVRELAPPILIARGGHPAPGALGPGMPEVSSTEVRRRLAAGEDASDLVPRVVLEHVRALNLYR